MPLRSSTLQLDFKVEDGALAANAAMPRADFRTASADYFRAAGIPLLQGRPFATSDTARGGRVVIINQELANKLFPNESPVGKTLAWTGDILRFTPLTREWRRIVGVVGNTRDGGMDATPRAAVFMPFAQELVMGAGFVIRADGDASNVATSATSVVRGIAPAALIENVMTVAQIKDQSVSPRRLNAVLISLFGALALIIAAVGIAGVLAFSVSARTNEIGIRMSLGADGGRVLRMILLDGGALLAVGLVLGTASALLASGVIRGLLFGVGPRDPITFAGVIVVMAIVGLIACWIPARRAARIDPAIAMRAQ
jgi:putative ABC transport system permease protein